MSEYKPTWKLIDEEIGIWEAVYRVPGFKCRTVAIRLKSGGFLLYSPGGGLIESAQKEILNSSEVDVLLVPNFVHHLGLAKWRKQYPKAIAVASEIAMPRLKKQGHADLHPLSKIADLLPEKISYLEPEGTRMGESWLQAETAKGIMWIVCDLFFNHPHVSKKIIPRLIMKAMKAGPGLSVSRITYWGGIKNHRSYREWVLRQLEESPPKILLPNHGDMLTDDNLPEKIRQLV